MSSHLFFFWAFLDYIPYLKTGMLSFMFICKLWVCMDSKVSEGLLRTYPISMGLQYWQPQREKENKRTNQFISCLYSYKLFISLYTGMHDCVQMHVQHTHAHAHFGCHREWLHCEQNMPPQNAPLGTLFIWTSITSERAGPRRTLWPPLFPWEQEINLLHERYLPVPGE